MAAVLLIVSPFIGSWIGTLALRLPAGEPLVLGRSRCRHCGRPLAPRDLVPLLSWLAARGRCRHCGGQIGPYYPLVELAALAVVAAALAVASGPEAAAGSLLGWALLALALCDLGAFLLPDVITLPLIAGGLAAALLLPSGEGGAPAAHLIGAVAGYGVFAGLGWAYRALRGREGLGGGDAKLMAAAGAWLGWAPLPLVVLLGAGLALAAALVRYRRLTLGAFAGQSVPFGAPLALAIYIVWLLERGA